MPWRARALILCSQFKQIAESWADAAMLRLPINVPGGRPTLFGLVAVRPRAAKAGGEVILGALSSPIAKHQDTEGLGVLLRSGYAAKRGADWPCRSFLHHAETAGSGGESMKLLRYGPAGQEKPGVLHDGKIRDLSGVIGDLTGNALGRESLNRLTSLDPATLPMVEGNPRIGAPVGLVPKFLGIGLNYRDHAEETGMPIPEVPIVFAKASSCVSGPYDPVLAPKAFQRMDYEVELAVVIGTKAKHVAEAGALGHVAGYCICNDVSERSLQKGGPGEWIKAKSYDTFGPLGPWLVTTDEIADPQNLDLALDLNGTRMQTGSTSTMIFGIAALVAYISKFMTLMPGDVITTGTPPGVGMARNPRVFLKPGDEIRATISGLGEQRWTVVAEG
jgi:2-keto-4-pentenoate hydratase/2-oxohepta-3-ene-1,7-dioic acid hydratase in catechol pathway